MKYLIYNQIDSCQNILGTQFHIFVIDPVKELQAHVDGKEGGVCTSDGKVVRDWHLGRNTFYARSSNLSDCYATIEDCLQWILKHAGTANLHGLKIEIKWPHLPESIDLEKVS